MEKKRKNIMTKANRNQKANKNQSEKRRNISPKPASVFSVQKGQEMELEITGLGSAGKELDVTGILRCLCLEPSPVKR